MIQIARDMCICISISVYICVHMCKHEICGLVRLFVYAMCELWCACMHVCVRACASVMCVCICFCMCVRVLYVMMLIAYCVSMLVQIFVLTGSVSHTHNTMAQHGVTKPARFAQIIYDSCNTLAQTHMCETMVDLTLIGHWIVGPLLQALELVGFLDRVAGICSLSTPTPKLVLERQDISLPIVMLPRIVVV